MFLVKLRVSSLFLLYTFNENPHSWTMKELFIGGLKIIYSMKLLSGAFYFIGNEDVEALGQILLRFTLRKRGTLSQVPLR